MPGLKVVHFPDPILKRPTPALKALTAEHRALIASMLKAMYGFPNCVGIAAPQVGHSVPIAVMNASVHPKAKKQKTHGELVLVNPKIIAHQGKTSMREGCLSVPDLTGNTQRYAEVTVEAWDVEGQLQRWDFSGFEAIVAQHEIDHLNGTLFLDRVADSRAIFRRKKYL